MIVPEKERKNIVDDSGTCSRRVGEVTNAETFLITVGDDTEGMLCHSMLRDAQGINSNDQG